MLEIKRAVRRALPLQIAFYGPSGSGKTMSALLFAAGLANGGKVAVIDTERGRASLYSDNKRVLAALGGPYDVLELDQPYHPQRFIEALDVVENAGYKVCLIDSASDAWDGPGGCASITEENKGRWNKAKVWNKRLMTRMVLSNMHTITCLKAQEKTKIISKDDSPDHKEHVIPMGVLPICEKNFFYPMLLGFSVDPKTHLSEMVKAHEDLAWFFQKPKLITKEDGEMVRKWNETGSSMDPHEQLKKRARAAAEDGVDSYAIFFGGLQPTQKKVLIDSVHAEYKDIAAQADKDRAPEEEPAMAGAGMREPGEE